MLKIGPYQLSSIETGRFALDGGAMFGIVPKAIWQKTNPADDLNRIDMHLRALLIQNPPQSQNILVDCGIGTKWAAKYESMYKIDHSQWSLDQSLKEKGLTPEDITDVILTHLHFDHAGGMTTQKDGTLHPTFPNAKVYVQKQNWDLAWNPTEKDKASYLSENYSLYQDELKGLLNLIETPATPPTGAVAFSLPDSQDTEIFPGISVWVSHGHTLGMQIVRISDGQETLYYCADLIPTATHVRVPFIMSYDCYPMFLLEEKKQLLARAEQENALLFYEHCPNMAASRIKRDEKGHYQAHDPIQI